MSSAQLVPQKVKFLYLVEDFHSEEHGAFISHDLHDESAQRTPRAPKREQLHFLHLGLPDPHALGSAAGAPPTAAEPLSVRARVGLGVGGSGPGNGDLKARVPSRQEGRPVRRTSGSDVRAAGRRGPRLLEGSPLTAPRAGLLPGLGRAGEGGAVTPARGPASPGSTARRPCCGSRARLTTWRWSYGLGDGLPGSRGASSRLSSSSRPPGTPGVRRAIPARVTGVQGCERAPGPVRSPEPSLPAVGTTPEDAAHVTGAAPGGRLPGPPSRRKGSCFGAAGRGAWSERRIHVQLPWGKHSP